MFDSKTNDAISMVAKEFDLEPAALLAIAEVESGGQVFVLVDARQEPLIRFEGHYFDARLAGDKRRRARAEGLASPVAGRIANPKSQADRWALLERAAAIDRKAAYESASWGIGQVMGAHWQMLGYGDVDALVAEARGGAAGQTRLMARYIDRTGLAAAIRKHDWKAFARGYNGPAYDKNAYDAKIAAAFTRYAGAMAGARKAVRATPGTAADIRALQEQLVAQGYAIAVDGAMGPQTRVAIRRFQAEHGLGMDGVAGPATRDALAKAAAPVVETPPALGILGRIAGYLRRFDA